TARYSTQFSARIATRSPRANPRRRRPRATPFAIASSAAKLNSRGRALSLVSMRAIFSRLSVRSTRSPRLVKCGMTGIGAFLALGRRRQIGAAPACDQLSVLIEDARLGGGDLAAEADHRAARREVARHGGAMIIDPQIEGRNPASGAPNHRPIGREIDQRGEHAAMRIAPLRVHHPLLAPARLELDTVFAERDHLEPQPLVIGPAQDHLLDLLDGQRVAHGSTTTLPITSRSRMRRSPSLASARETTWSITGFIFPSAIIVIRAARLSS